MKRRTALALMAVGLMASLGEASPGHAALIGLQQGNNTTLAGVYSIDTTTGVQTLIGNSGFAALQDLALAPDGTYYATAGSNATLQLLTINATTGAGTSISSLTTTDPGGLSFMNGLAVAPDGTLYGAGLAVGGSISNLYNINRATGVATLIGTTNAASVQALTFNAAGVLYGVNAAGDSTTRGLRSFNTATGNSTFIGPTTDSGSQAIQDIVFDPSGTLWGVTQTGNLDTITSSGVTVNFSGLVGFRGVENLAPVPVPAAVWLFGSGLASLVGIARRRKGQAEA